MVSALSEERSGAPAHHDAIFERSSASSAEMRRSRQGTSAPALNIIFADATRSMLHAHTHCSTQSSRSTPQLVNQPSTARSVAPPLPPLPSDSTLDKGRAMGWKNRNSPGWYGV